MTEKPCTKPLLLASLAANLLLVGLLAGLLLARPHHPPGPPPPAAKSELHRAFEDARKRDPEAVKAMNAARSEAIALLEAPEFDPRAYRIALQRMHDARWAMGEEMLQSLAERAEEMTPDQRRELAAQMKEQRQYWKKTRRP